MGVPKVSKRLVAAYVLDWLLIVVFLLISYGLNFLTPRYHAFSLVDLDISFPYVDEIVSTAALIVASVVGPAVIILLVSFTLVPSPAAHRGFAWKTLIGLKFWELNIGWLGLALSEATALLVTQGLKNIIGKPRPDLLSRCNPNVDNIAAHTVGGYAARYSAEWVLVDQTICQQPDSSFLNDGFRSFPSGHSSTSWAGLLYLTLYLCSKFSVAFPYLPQRSSAAGQLSSEPNRNMRLRDPSSESQAAINDGAMSVKTLQTLDRDRTSAAAPPLWTVLLAYVPIGVALYISSSRYFQYYHHGFDVIVGSILGAATSFLSFRLYHMPVGRSAGWSWGPRSASRAFGTGVASHGWVEEIRQVDRAEFQDVELGSLRDTPQEHDDTVSAHRT